MNVSQALTSIDRRLEVMTGVLVDQVGELRELRHASDRQAEVLGRQTDVLSRQTDQLARQSEQIGHGTERTDALTGAVLRALERLDRQDRDER